MISFNMLLKYDNTSETVRFYKIKAVSLLICVAPQRFIHHGAIR